MTASPIVRRAPSLVAALLVAMALALAPASQPAAAFQVEDRGTSNLDGDVVMSPSAERIETVEPDGGEQIGPGSVVTRPVIIHNRSEETIDFDLQASQVVGSTAELVVHVRHGVREGAAAWVTLERPTLTLKPGQQGTVIVTVKIPSMIKPGSKPFAISATRRSAAVQGQGGAGVAPQFTQVGIFILELPGDAPIKGRLTGASITSAQKGVEAGQVGDQSPRNSRFYVSPGWYDTHELSLSAEYENDGERLLRPSGRVVVRDVFGRVAQEYEIEAFTTYPGGKAAKRVDLKGLPSLGIFTARVEMESEQTGKQTTTLPRFVLVPKWFLLGVGLFLLYGTYRLVRWQLRRRREWRAYLDDGGAGSSEVDAGDSVDDVDADEWDFEDEPERV